jgi:hypothetical protein
MIIYYKKNIARLFIVAIDVFVVVIIVVIVVVVIVFNILIDDIVNVVIL